MTELKLNMEVEMSELELDQGLWELETNIHKAFKQFTREEGYITSFNVIRESDSFNFATDKVSIHMTIK